MLFFTCPSTMRIGTSLHAPDKIYGFSHKCVHENCHASYLAESFVLKCLKCQKCLKCLIHHKEGGQELWAVLSARSV